tara:strand:- start:352 stop:537 length:186 start_codon:yes stop_codon:yes gene_type:complete
LGWGIIGEARYKLLVVVSCGLIQTVMGKAREEKRKEKERLEEKRIGLMGVFGGRMLADTKI